MPPCYIRAEEQPAPVFGPDEEYTGSPLEEVGRLGLFKTHETEREPVRFTGKR